MEVYIIKGNKSNKSLRYFAVCVAFLLLSLSVYPIMYVGALDRKIEVVNRDSIPVTVSLYRNYEFLCASKAAEVWFVHNDILCLYPIHIFSTRSIHTLHTSDIYSSINQFGAWRINRNCDTVFFYGYTYSLENYLHYKDRLDDVKLLFSEDEIEPSLRGHVRDLTTIFIDSTICENVCYASIRNFGDELLLVRDIAPFYQNEPIERQYHRMFYVPHSLVYQEERMTYGQILSHRRDSIGTPYYPWEMVAVDWRRGRFKVVRKAFSRDSVPMIVTLEKDRFQFSVVNPTYYWPGSEFRFYRDEELPGLNAWMDSVRVGESYAFELSRPDYPADSIARFAPLQTVPDSIYAADGEAYGYFFAKRIKD